MDLALGTMIAHYGGGNQLVAGQHWNQDMIGEARWESRYIRYVF